MQTGGFDLSIHFSTITSSWEYTCLFGCHGFDYESEAEAQREFLFHRCGGNIPIGTVGSEPCS